MNKTGGPGFAAGANIAMKIPARDYDRTVDFYRNVIGLPLLKESPGSVVLEFGGKQLWLDRTQQLSQAEIWLEIRTDDTAAAREFFLEGGVARRDEIKTLPDGSGAFWIANPCGIIHLIRPS